MRTADNADPNINAESKERGALDHLVPFLLDPTVRQTIGPAVGNALNWTVSAIRARFETAPASVQKQVQSNTESFAELLAEKVAAKVRGDQAAHQAVNDELGSPRGFAALQQAMEVAAELDDDFTRENLAELVSRRLTTRGASRLHLGTKIATEALVYLSEQQLRLLAFMVFVQGLRPNTTPSDQAEWTATVLRWLQEIGPVLTVNPDHRDLDLLASAGLVEVMPAIVAFDLKVSLSSVQGFSPQIDDFISNDPMGVRIKSGFDLVKLHRLNLAGKILAVTIQDKITGVVTDVSDL